MLRSKSVLVQIQSLDKLLIDTGVRDYCVACVKSPEGGCCQGCSNLGPNGCMERNLACTLWLCGRAQQKFSEVNDVLQGVKTLFPPAITWGFRQGSAASEAGCMNDCTLLLTAGS